MIEPDIIYLPEFARRIGRTESAVASAIKRRAEWLPPLTKVGRRVGIKRTDYERWLSELSRIDCI